MFWSITAGGNLATGNTRSIAVSGSTRFKWRRGDNEVAADGQFVYGRASIRVDGEFDDWKTNADEQIARVRYDRYLTELDSVFGVVGGRRNRFAGLDIRLQGQAGYARSFFNEPNHRLWGELGYDITYDNFFPNPLVDEMTMEELPGHEVFHSARAFVGYDNHIGLVTFATGVEGLFDVEEASNYRVNWSNNLGAKVSTTFTVGLQFTLNYDHVPPEGAEKLDTLTLLTVTYLLLGAEAEAAACGG